MSKPTVLIIGGGLGGLTLAQSLREAGVPYKIFERDIGLEARAQGWSLLLHECLPSLRKIAPPSAPPIESISVTYNTPYKDYFHMFNGYTKEALLTFEGPIYAENSKDAVSISASRAEFRKWLTNDLDISWDHQFKKYEVLSNGRVKVCFTNGDTAEGDVLIGADGSLSAVRAQMYAGNPAAGALNRLPHAIVAGLVTFPKERYAKYMEYGPSLYTTDAAGLRVFVGLRHFSPDLSSATFVWLLFWVNEGAEKDKPHASLNAPPEAQLEYAREVTKELHSDFKEIFAETKADGMLGSLILQDRIPQLCPDGPVTLIGDAMHVMSPFRGEGGNAALSDAFELSAKLESASANFDAVLRAYERDMIPRAEDAVLRSREAGADFGTERVVEKLFNRAELSQHVKKEKLLATAI